MLTYFVIFTSARPHQSQNGKKHMKCEKVIFKMRRVNEKYVKYMSGLSRIMRIKKNLIKIR